MSKFSAVSERMAQEAAKDAAAADDLMAKLDAHAARRPVVVQKGNDWIKAQLEDEISAMENDLAKFSNSLPTQEAGYEPPKSGGNGA